jgi:hypothetical protein
VNSRGHWKFKTLRRNYGFEGEGRFWVLNCIIAEEENCRLDLSRKLKADTIAEELGMKLEEFNAFLDFLSDPELGLIKKDADGYYTERVDETLAFVLKNRRRQKKHYDSKKATTTKPAKKAPESLEKYRKFYREQFTLSEGQEYQQKYFHFVAYMFNEKGHENKIKKPGLHVLKIEKQITFKDYVTLFDYCMARNKSPIDFLDSWLNNTAYSKNKVSVYATLRSWASKEPITKTNLK